MIVSFLPFRAYIFINTNRRISPIFREIRLCLYINIYMPVYPIAQVYSDRLQDQIYDRFNPTTKNHYGNHKADCQCHDSPLEKRPVFGRVFPEPHYAHSSLAVIRARVISCSLRAFLIAWSVCIANSYE